MDTKDAQDLHANLKQSNIAWFKMEMADGRDVFERVSKGLFQWFRHMGFWHQDQSARATADPLTVIEITVGEYIRLKKAEKIALIHSELSEMLEAIRKGDVENEAEEWADVLVRHLDYNGGFQTNGMDAFEKKQLVNYERPYKHGKKF